MPVKVKQVFSAYDVEKFAIPGNFNYCPVCGEKLAIKEDTGRNRLACPGCGFIYYRNPSPAVSVLILKDDKVLLGKRASSSFKAGMWCMPGGFIEFDEDFLTAGRREVQEETGLNVEIQSILSVMCNYLRADLHTLVVVLLAHVVNGELCPGDDLEAVEWFPLSGPFPELAFAADEHIIARYYQTRVSGAPVDKEYAAAED